MDIWRADGLDIKPENCVLGLDWNTESHCLFTNPGDITKNLKAEPGTKGSILHMTARYYDILGPFVPAPIIGKILVQEP
jgi:hypothetical protein